MRYYHPDIVNRFGANLNTLFSGTRPTRSASIDDLAEILRAVKKCKLGKDGHIDTSEWGSRTYLSVMETVLEFMSACLSKDLKCVFQQYELPAYNFDSGVKGLSEEGLCNWDSLLVNYKAQRVINMVNVVKYLFNFNPQLVFGAKGRRYQGKTYINDGQHGTILLGIVGVEKLPVIFVESPHESIDFDHFLAFNVDNYEAEEFDKHRNKVQRATRMIAENGIQNIYPSDKVNYDCDLLLQRHDVRFVPQAKKILSPGDTQHVNKMLNLFEEYFNKKGDIFEKALVVSRKTWRGHAVPQEPIWGLCELIKAQNKEISTREWEKVENALVSSLQRKWPSGPNTVWPEIKAVINKMGKMPQYKDRPETNTSNRGKMIAQAMVEVVHAWDRILPTLAGNKVGHGVSLKSIIRDGLTGEAFEYHEGFPVKNMGFEDRVRS